MAKESIIEDDELGFLEELYVGPRRVKVGRTIGFLSLDLFSSKTLRRLRRKKVKYGSKGYSSKGSATTKKGATKVSGGGKPVTKSNVKKAGYDAPSEQGKQSMTAKPGAFGAQRSLSKKIGKALKSAR